MNAPDLAIIGFITLLLWGARKLPDLSRQLVDPNYNPASEDKFFAFALMLLIIGIVMWLCILAEHL